MSDIFISYKREDRERVEPLAQALEREGFSVWWDPEMPIGQSYSTAIRGELTQARAVIAVWTTLSVQSEWVQEEATQGKRRGVLFPVRFDAVDPPMGFTMVETVDLSDWQIDDRDHAEWTRLLEQLRAKMHASAPITAARAGGADANPPRVERARAANRPMLVAGSVAVVVAIAAGVSMVRRERPAEPPTSTPAGSATADSAPGASAPVASTPAAAPAVAPRDVAAPPIVAGGNATIGDARPLALSVAEPGEILAGDETRFYRVDNALTLRDLVVVRFQNESTTLRPDVKILDADKSLIVQPYDGNQGASVQATVPIEPGQPLFVQILPHNAAGKYRISVTPQKAYDTFEPNDNVLTPSAVKVGTDVVASIMDDKDHDWYRVSGATKPNLTVTFENLSTTLRPSVKVYDGNKSLVVEKFDSTAGANLSFTADIKDVRDFYVEVVPYRSPGKYRLRID